jgi:hypothetical protein
MKLAFKEIETKGFFKKTKREVIIEREVEITLNIATLEALTKDMGIELYQISERIKKEADIFMIGLLYHGYVIACKDRYEKLKYNKTNAIFWYEKMNKEAQSELLEKIDLLSGEIEKMSGKKKSKNDI